METIQNDYSSQINDKSPRLFVFVGAYGSGKSEVSVHFARKLKRENPGRKSCLQTLILSIPFTGHWMHVKSLKRKTSV